MSSVTTCTGINNPSVEYWLVEETLQGEAAEIVLGINLSTDEAFSFLLKVPVISSKIRIMEEDKDARKMRLSWIQNYKNDVQYYFDVSICNEGNLCDLHFKPATKADSQKLPNAVASVVEAMSSQGGIRVGELRDYSQLEQEPPTDQDLEKVLTFLQQHVLSDLEQICSSLGMLHLTASLCLHRLIDNGVIGCSPIGTGQIKLFYYK